VIGFNTSGTDKNVDADWPAIQMASVTPLGNSGFQLIRQVIGKFEDDFSCPTGVPAGTCRWGDYSGASPDPGASPYANRGEVWLTNMYVKGGVDQNDVDWATFNWESVPTVTAKMTQPSNVFQKARPVGVAWQDVHGSLTYDVRFRSAPWNGYFGPWAPLDGDTNTPNTNDTLFAATGRTYCFSVQPRDVSGSWGFGIGRCTAVPLDDRELDASGPWARNFGPGFFAKTFSQSSSLGATLSKGGIRARQVMVLVETCPTCGSIQLFWNGQLVRSYNLFSPAVHQLVYLKVVTFGSVHVGALTIRVSSSGKPVIIDGLGVSRV
jgi:hypothetical protein